MDRSGVQAWLDRYVAAWKSYDQAEIESLFAPDATYRYHPYDAEFLVGRAAIVKEWLDNRDEAGTYDARYEPYAVDGDRAVAIGRSSYWTDATRSTLSRAYDNVFLLRYDSDGRCVEFTESFMTVPEKVLATAG
jgi:hypothetical protein